MSAYDFSKIATALAWPITVLLVLVIFYRPLRGLLQRLSEALIFKSLKVQAFGMEVELSAEYARTVLNELLDDITESTNSLSIEEVSLFDQILSADGSKTIGDLIPGFSRDDTTGYHRQLRNLRDQKLIIPKERGRWKPEKHPIVTRYGRLVAKLRSTSSVNVQKFRNKADG